MRTIAVLGAGSWGTALAVHLGRLGHDVRLWARNADLVAEIERDRVHRNHKDVALPSTLAATTDLPAACRDADAIVVALGMRVLEVSLEAVLGLGAIFIPTLRRIGRRA